MASPVKHKTRDSVIPLNQKFRYKLIDCVIRGFVRVRHTLVSRHKKRKYVKMKIKREMLLISVFTWEKIRSIFIPSWCLSRQLGRKRYFDLQIVFVWCLWITSCAGIWFEGIQLLLFGQQSHVMTTLCDNAACVLILQYFQFTSIPLILVIGFTTSWLFFPCSQFDTADKKFSLLMDNF